MSLLGVAGSLVGGLLSKPKNKYVIPPYQQIRDQAEAAGFHPAFALSNAPGSVVQTSNPMGQAIADSAMMLADSLAKRPAAARLDQAQAENKKLREQVQSLTLRPKVGGVYAQREAVPSARQALGINDAPRSGSGLSGPHAARVSGDDGLSPLLTESPLDPRRPVQVLPVPSDGGHIMVDMPALGPAFPVPASQGEILETQQLPVIGGAYLFDRARRALGERREFLQNHTVGKPLRAPSSIGVSRVWELAPPPTRKFPLVDIGKHPPKPKGYQKNIYDTRPLFQQWGVY